MIAILDIQHLGKPGKNDLGASHDIDGDGVVEAWEHEAKLTPIYVAEAERVLTAAGVDVVVLSSGWYSTRWKKAAKIARENPDQRVAYVACHLNARGDYGLVCYDYRSSGGAALASSCHLSMLREWSRPEVPRVFAEATAPEEEPKGSRDRARWRALPRYEGRLHWPRPWWTLHGIYDGPANLSGVCYEPLALQSHPQFMNERGLGRVGRALAAGLLDWLQK